MTDTNQKRIKELIDRLSRIVAADERVDEINSTQWTALAYLARANKFSRSPSQVTDFMVATRGTVSQTLKALAKKGFIEEARSEQDKRSISYSVTEKGMAMVDRQNIIESALSLLEDEECSNLLSGLEAVVLKALKINGLRPFGICKSCIHYKLKTAGGYCKLLKEELLEFDANQICHEHSSVAPRTYQGF